MTAPRTPDPAAGSRSGADADSAAGTPRSVSRPRSGLGSWLARALGLNRSRPQHPGTPPSTPATSGADVVTPRLRQPGLSRDAWLEEARRMDAVDVHPAASQEDPQGAGAAQEPRAHALQPTGVTRPLTIERVERMLTGPMDYGVDRRVEEDGHVCLVGSWDGYPFMIEEPEGHVDVLLVTGEREEPVRPEQRDEVAASVNDWNREKFFPTVALAPTPVGEVVRAIYLVDLSQGVSDAQLRLHLETALSACTQALAQVGPLLPEI